jgi:two-component system, NarL family, nitrate/nitrite response regulator NarL
MKRLRLLIADDHPLFVLGIKYALVSQGFEVVAEASDGQEAVQASLRCSPDVVLLDIKMPELDGIEACRQITAKDPSVTVIMLTTFDEPGIISAARQAGARGYVSKETPPLELAKIIQTLISNPGKNWFPEIALPSLTAGEQRVLVLLVQGLSNKDIAKALELSPETVKDYLARIYSKLEVSDRLGAIDKARRLGLAGSTSLAP